MPGGAGLAQQLAHPFSLTLALFWAAVLHHLRREAPLTQARAEAAMTIATDQGFSELFARARPCGAGRWPRVGTGRRAERRSSRAWLPPSDGVGKGPTV